MLQIKDIHKEYKTGSLVQKALDGVSLNLRENEFVAVLGPSGSGKTTLLNIIGGLDRYDSGDLIINGISTRRYKDRDWDSYRNHTIGFVFQSYNLIPHQSILSNVELALTISGVSKGERRRRAQSALEQVGLGDQLHKRPSQMSGGQMQRVAIARALVNDPDILLADEPTGALDSDTSVQVMELLKKVAKDRLVVMVTHNPELAEEYATRIVKLRDGKICSDTAPFEISESSRQEPVHKNMGKASMSFLTALSLSFHNLRTKKARTLLTSFAGSIGIIGIALILALSNGVNTYIQSIEENTLSEYPLQIQSSGMDFTAIMEDGSGRIEGGPDQAGVTRRVTSVLAKVEANDLGSLKEYFDSGESGIEEYTKAIEYSYGVTPQIFRLEGDSARQVNPDRSFSDLGIGSASGGNSFMSMMMNTDVFHAMPEDASLYQSQYDVKAGRWPERYDECVVVLTSGGSISDLMLYAMGLRDHMELDGMVRQFIAEEEIEEPEDLRPYDYDELLDVTFKLVNAAECYEYDETYGIWKDKSDDEAYMRTLVSQGEDIKIVGVVQPSEDAKAAMLDAGIGYPASLTEHIIRQAEKSPIVEEQLASPGINVLTGEAFGAENGEGSFNMESLFTINEDALQEAISADPQAMDPTSADPGEAFHLDPDVVAGAIEMNMDEEELTELIRSMMAAEDASLDGNLSSFGYAAWDKPSQIDIYPVNFESKESITQILDAYNHRMTGDGQEEKVISYTDLVGTMMSSVTEIINTISYVLVAFVAISLVVSSIMIGAITYISVLERKKEIGILRAIGASKGNISQVFNAETFIVGLCAGLIGIGMTLLLLIPGNAVIHSLAGSTDVNAALPWASAVVLILLSVVLTLIGGLIPSRKAAKSDPVAALRAE